MCGTLGSSGVCKTACPSGEHALNSVSCDNGQVCCGSKGVPATSPGPTTTTSDSGIL